MSFDQKSEFSEAGTVELSDDTLEGVIGGVTLTYDPNYEPPEHLKIEVMKPPASTLIGTPSVQEPQCSPPNNLEQAIANTEEAQNRVLAGPPKVSIGNQTQESYLGFIQK